MYEWDFSSVWEYRDLLLNGLGLTVMLAVAVVIAGMILGTINAIGSLSRHFAFQLFQYQ